MTLLLLPITGLDVTVGLAVGVVLLAGLEALGRSVR